MADDETPSGEATAREPVDLTNCDREPIHIPGSIQAHGCLLACDPGLGTLLRHSANAPAFLGLAATALNGAALSELLGRELAHELRNALASSIDPTRPGLVLGVELQGASGVFDIAVHRHDEAALIEIERAASGRAASPLEIARALLARIRSAETIDEIVRRAPRLMRGLLGYDRVMVYRFAEDDSGKVVSEAKRGDLESFLGQHFPASDIPKQARALYLRNTIRVISDANGARVPVLPELDESGAPLDLSFAHLRSVSPIHTEYMRNMGVSASMSISIIVGGKLWGLIACHHYAPKALSMSERVAAEMFGDFFSLQIETVAQKRMLASARAARRALDGLMRELASQTDVVTFLGANIEVFRTLLPCDGAGVWINGVWSGAGLTAPKEAVPVLARHLDSVDEGRVWSCDGLAEELPETAPFGGEAAGVLAIPLSQLGKDYVFLFRKEQLQTVDWAGDPNKTYETGPMGDRLTPRKSFAIWKETVRGRSLPWSEHDLEIAEAARTTLLEVILRHTELLADERRKADVRQKVLNEELNHRVKNILALIKSLVSQPVDEARGLTDYVEALKGRIMALSNAHDQVARSDQGGALSDLIAAELSPYRDAAAELSVEGPDIGLDARAYSVIALVIHELATNAAKYGALSVKSGRLEVSWALDGTGACVLHWRESGGPEVSKPNREGFGSVLLERSIPFDLGGESEVVYAPEGVRARLLAPARFVSVQPPPPLARRSEAGGEAEPASINGRRVLLVEDQLVIALDVEAMLSAKGVASVETAATIEEALSRLREAEPDAAVLDINLGMVTSMPVAEELARRGVPFIFASGYGDSAMIPEQFGAVPVVRKPYEAEKLAAALGQALAAAGR